MPDHQTDAALTTCWRPGRPVDLLATLGPLIRGSGDPTHRWSTDGLWRTCRTPAGPASMHLRVVAGHVLADAWGPGASWALDQMPTLLGTDDDPQGFVPHHRVVAQALHRRPGWRVPRTELVVEAMIPAVFEQLVTGKEAFAAWRTMVRRFGEPAPGPAGGQGMWVLPTPQQWMTIPSWEWLQAGVDGKRSSTVIRVAARAGRLERTLDLPTDQVERGLCSIPGVGVWTAAETRQRAHGDPDAVSFGDFHVAKDIGWALIGEAVDDDGLAELLEPYRPHRYRVQRLLSLEVGSRPRRGPRPAPRRHVPVRGW